MKISVKGRGMTVTKALQEYLEEKMGKVAKIVGNVDRLEAVFIKQPSKNSGEDHKIEVTLHSPQAVLRAEETTVSMYASIDIAATKLERQARKLKDRRSRKGQAKGSTMVKQTKGAKAEPESDSLKIVRSKVFALKPMNVEDAAVHLDAIGHDFYLFTNAESMRTNVLYRRKDGNLGLIEPA